MIYLCPQSSVLLLAEISGPFWADMALRDQRKKVERQPWQIDVISLVLVL